MPAKSDDKGKKVFDVAKPGKSAPSSSSRPTIIGHKNMLKDPMVKDDSVSEIEEPKEKIIIIPEDDKPSGSPPLPPNQTSDDPASSPSATKINIKPINKDVAPEDDEVTEKPPKTSGKDGNSQEVRVNLPKDEQPVAEETNTGSEEATDDAEKPQEAEVEDSISSEDTQTSEEDDKEDTDKEGEEPTDKRSTEDKTKAATVEAVAGQADVQKRFQKQTEEEKARRTAAEKLVAEQKYFVPIGQVKRRRNNMIAILILLLLLALVGGYLAVDAGLIETTVELPFEFIKN